MIEREQQRTVEKEKTAIVEREYEKERVFVRAITSGKYSIREERERQRAAPRIYKYKDSKWRGGPQHFHKTLLNPELGHMQTLQSSITEMAPGGYSQRHGHQNTALLYVLSGRGYDIHDGKRIDWEEGDMCLVAPGTVHQHFNLDNEKPARFIIIKTKPIYNFANLNFQEFKEKSPELPVPGWENFEPDADDHGR